MIIIPIRLPESYPRGPVVLVLVIEKENLERMRAADPFDLHLSTLAGHMLDSAIGKLDLVVAYEEDIGRLLEFKEDLVGLMDYLERGRKIVAGDLQPPVPLRKI